MQSVKSFKVRGPSSSTRRATSALLRAFLSDAISGEPLPLRARPRGRAPRPPGCPPRPPGHPEASRPRPRPSPLPHGDCGKPSAQRWTTLLTRGDCSRVAGLEHGKKPNARATSVAIVVSDTQSFSFSLGARLRGCSEGELMRQPPYKNRPPVPRGSSPVLTLEHAGPPAHQGKAVVQLGGRANGPWAVAQPARPARATPRRLRKQGDEHRRRNRSARIVAGRGELRSGASSSRA